MPWGRLVLYGSTAVAIVVGVRSAWGSPPPLGWAVGFALVYLGILALGSMVPRLEMYGDVLWRVKEADAHVALTFDDGPDPHSTPLVLETLRRHGARATFFVLGKKAEMHPELLQCMMEEGHAIGIHSYSHQRAYAFLPPKEVLADIEKCQKILENAVGRRSVWFRPPVGQTSPRTIKGAKLAGVEIVGWSVKGRDGLRSTSTDEVVKRVGRGLCDGAIVLLHDAWEKGAGDESPPPAGVDALESLLRECQSRRLSPVTVEELVARIPLEPSRAET